MRYFLLILFSFIAVSHAGYWGKDTVFVSSCSASGYGCIYVEKGCKSAVPYPLTSFADKELSEKELFEKVFGPDSLSDSTKVYEEWAEQCAEIYENTKSDGLIVSLGAIALGSAFTALGVYMTMIHEYEYTGTKAAGNIFGSYFFAFGSITTLVWLVSIPDQFSNKNNSYEEREKYYRSNAERFKMRALPAVDPKNQAAGLFFQMVW